MRVVFLCWFATWSVQLMHGMGRSERTLFDPHVILLVLIVLGSRVNWVLPHVILYSLVRVPTTVEPASVVLFHDLLLASLLLFARHAFYLRGVISLSLVGFSLYYMGPLLVEWLRPVTVEGASAFAPAMLTGCLVPVSAWLLRRIPGFRTVFVLGGRR